MSRIRVGVLLSLVLVGSTGAQAAAATDDEWFKAVGPRAWLINYDPTLLGSRLYNETSYEQDRGGDYTVEMKNQVRLASAPLDGLAVGGQLELPIKWARKSGDEISGLSAYEVRTGFVVRLSPTLRWGNGLNLKVPTAAGIVLDGPWTELRPITAVSWDARDWLNLGFNLAYYFTPDNTGPDGTNKFELTVPVAYKFSDAWSAILSAKPIYYLATSSLDHRLQGGVTYLFGAQRQFAIFPSFEVPLGLQQLEWKSTLRLVWSF